MCSWRVKGREGDNFIGQIQIFCAIFIEDLERVDGCVLVGLMVGIYSATILSLFDGVFVVPYAQQWLCFLCGSVLAI